MKFKAGITDARMADTINREAYNAECDALNCPTPEAKRKTKRAFVVEKHPSKSEWRLRARTERLRAIAHTRESHKNGWIEVTDTTEDEWKPFIVIRKNGLPVHLKRTLQEPDRYKDKRARMSIDNALDEIISERE